MLSKEVVVVVALVSASSFSLVEKAPQLSNTIKGLLNDSVSLTLMAPVIVIGENKSENMIRYSGRRSCMINNKTMEAAIAIHRRLCTFTLLDG